MISSTAGLAEGDYKTWLGNVGILSNTINYCTYIDISYTQYTGTYVYIFTEHTCVQYIIVLVDHPNSNSMGTFVAEVKALVATTTFANDTKHRGHQRL